MNEYVILVDEHDVPTGTAEKLAAHQQGLLHRAVSVVVLNPVSGELLLQRRALGKYHCAGLWTNTACSHPRPGEDTNAAAERRLQEEMGLQVDVSWVFPLVYRATFGNGLIEHEYDHVFVGYTVEQPTPNPSEVMDYRWVAFADILHETAAHPERFTPWFLLMLPLVQQHLQQHI